MKRMLATATFAAALFATAAHAQFSIDSMQDYDGYIHLYESSFDPTDQLTNLLGGNDDGPGGIGTSLLEGLTLNPGTDYILVTSGFQAGDAGSYTATITDGDVTVNLAGDTSNGLTWDRPIAGGPTISGLGPVNYEAITFQVPEPASLALLAMGAVTLIRRR